ncbi:hypothetical protein ONS96_003037 [Cadophora gregata f. sp. sojae]|nr:hypothetical protein ONS96_003037 [Cadophora gregata f. sp. sojae]
MESPKSYQYDQLTEPGALRLIALQPDHNIDAPVRCSLISTTLQACHDDIVEQYTALSYVWGNTNHKIQISVDGMPLDITASLDLALRYIRQSDKPIRVWADGICINQQDVSEKNIQVAQMGLIYEVANHTIIFLGLATEQSQGLIQAIKSLPPRPAFVSLETEASYSQGKQGLLNLLTYPWFTRVWTLQELVLSADPWIQCGNSRCKWDVLAKYIPRMLESATEDGIQPLTDMNLFRMSSMKNRYATDEQKVWATDEDAVTALLLILHSRRGLGATDARDFIYAHLGIICKRLQAAISIDYTKSCSTIYTEFARQALAWMPSLDILQIRGTQSPARVLEGLPSWVPDWSQPIKRLPPGISVSGSEAAPKARQNYKYQLLHPESTLLMVHVKLIGTIEKILPPASINNDIYWSEDESRSYYRFRCVPTDEDAKFQEVMLYFYGLMLARTWDEDFKASVMEGLSCLDFEFPSFQEVILRKVTEKIFRTSKMRVPPCQGDPMGRDEAELWELKMHRVCFTLLRLAHAYLSTFPYRLALLSNGALTLIPEDVCIGDNCFLDVGAGISSRDKRALSMQERYAAYINTSIFVRLDTSFCMPGKDSHALAKALNVPNMKEGVLVPESDDHGPFRILARGPFEHVPSLKQLTEVDSSYRARYDSEAGVDVVLLS